MAGQFAGKVAIVTGAGSGIGQASSLALAKEGARVVVTDVAAERGSQTLQMIKKMGADAIFVEADVSRSREVEALVRKAVDTYGRLDFAHNNAAIEGALASTVDCTEENWDRTIGVDLKGVWLCMKYEIPQMLKQGKGVIVNTASVAGLIGSPAAPAFCAAKAGVVNLSRAAALDYSKSGIRINCVCPGIIRTPMTERVIAAAPEMKAALDALHPIGRIGEPEENAAAVVWLCSDVSSFVSGHPLVLDGGWTVE